MAMSMGGAKSSIAEINVTPMIDVLLVLLIIFMVIVPMTPKGLKTLLPQPPKVLVRSSPEDAIVVQVTSGRGTSPTYKINETEVQHSQLLQQLNDIFANRAERTMFVKSDGDVSFSAIADVIDIGKAANVDQIGLMTSGIQTSH